MFFSIPELLEQIRV